MYALGAGAFQFLLVRLKGPERFNEGCLIKISIPFGAIKSKPIRKDHKNN